MILPIHYDLGVSIIGLLAGLYVFAFKIHVFNPRTYTPFLPAMVVASGIMYWGMLLMVSFASVYHQPEWLYKIEWQGTWGYTAARMLNALVDKGYIGGDVADIVQSALATDSVGLAIVVLIVGFIGRIIKQPKL